MLRIYHKYNDKNLTINTVPFQQVNQVLNGVLRFVHHQIFQ